MKRSHLNNDSIVTKHVQHKQKKNKIHEDSFDQVKEDSRLTVLLSRESSQANQVESDCIQFISSTIRQIHASTQLLTTCTRTPEFLNRVIISFEMMTLAMCRCHPPDSSDSQAYLVLLNFYESEFIASMSTLPVSVSACAFFVSSLYRLLAMFQIYSHNIDNGCVSSLRNKITHLFSRLVIAMPRYTRRVVEIFPFGALSSHTTNTTAWNSSQSSSSPSALTDEDLALFRELEMVSTCASSSTSTLFSMTVSYFAMLPPLHFHVDHFVGAAVGVITSLKEAQDRLSLLARISHHLLERRECLLRSPLVIVAMLDTLVSNCAERQFVFGVEEMYISFINLLQCVLHVKWQLVQSTINRKLNTSVQSSPYLEVIRINNSDQQVHLLSLVYVSHIQLADNIWLFDNHLSDDDDVLVSENHTVELLSVDMLKNIYKIIIYQLKILLLKNPEIPNKKSTVTKELQHIVKIFAIVRCLLAIRRQDCTFQLYASPDEQTSRYDQCAADLEKCVSASIAVDHAVRSLFDHAPLVVVNQLNSDVIAAISMLAMDASLVLQSPSSHSSLCSIESVGNHLISVSQTINMTISKLSEMCQEEYDEEWRKVDKRFEKELGVLVSALAAAFEFTALLSPKVINVVLFSHVIMYVKHLYIFVVLYMCCELLDRVSLFAISDRIFGVGTQC